MSKLFIIGCGGHARSVADCYLQSHPLAELIFIDSNARPAETVLGFETSREINIGLIGEAGLFIGLGDNQKRAKCFYENTGQNIISILAPTAYISNSAEISKGCFIGNFCHIGPEALIAENTIINTASIIEHGVRIGMHTHIGPNATISGNTSIGNHVFIGVGATVIDKISICDDVILGAGSCVIKDITEPGTYVGSPAIKIK